MMIFLNQSMKNMRKEIVYRKANEKKKIIKNAEEENNVDGENIEKEEKDIGKDIVGDKNALKKFLNKLNNLNKDEALKLPLEESTSFKTRENIFENFE